MHHHPVVYDDDKQVNCVDVIVCIKTAQYNA